MSRLATVFATLAALSMGFYFGSLWTARQVKTTFFGELPQWVETVQTVQDVTLFVFGLCVLAAIAIDYYENERQ